MCCCNLYQFSGGTEERERERGRERERRRRRIYCFSCFYILNSLFQSFSICCYFLEVGCYVDCYTSAAAFFFLFCFFILESIKLQTLMGFCSFSFSSMLHATFCRFWHTYPYPSLLPCSGFVACSLHIMS